LNAANPAAQQNPGLWCSATAVQARAGGLELSAALEQRPSILAEYFVGADPRRHNTDGNANRSVE
jgi:hypothetical protein